MLFHIFPSFSVKFLRCRFLSGECGYGVAAAAVVVSCGATGLHAAVASKRSLQSRAGPYQRRRCPSPSTSLPIKARCCRARCEHFLVEEHERTSLPQCPVQFFTSCPERFAIHLFSGNDQHHSLPVTVAQVDRPFRGALHYVEEGGFDLHWWPAAVVSCRACATRNILIRSVQGRHLNLFDNRTSGR